MAIILAKLVVAQTRDWRGEKLSNSGYDLKVEQARSTIKLDVGCERKKKIKDDTKFFGLINQKMESPFIRMGKTVEVGVAAMR